MTAGDELEDLLNKESRVILAGQLRDLESLAARKIALVLELRSSKNMSTKHLIKLVNMSSQNASLLEASGRGIKAAIHQIEEASAMGDQKFYGPDGERKRITSRPEKLQQRF